ncbi:MAG: hypothetical protein H0X30_12985 [Anaerolineae bacterium]|nr:hypothetical protein [Anaerolineae bacterium]
MKNANLDDLFAQYDAASHTDDHELVRRYAPIIHFDAREPFLPLAAGYTLFREDSESPSFPCQIELHKAGYSEAAFAIEYAIWWDWDIHHLYELEHIWVYVDSEGQVVRGEASAHGGHQDMSIDGQLNLTDDRLNLFSEPGKHAFAPIVEWLENGKADTVANCGVEAGTAGLCTPPVIEGYIHSTPEDDRRILAYLQTKAFMPSMDFTQIFDGLNDCLVPWSLLFNWIPSRIDWWKTELQRLASSS